MDRYSEIAKIAYELYLQRGGAPGDPQTDWLVAEKIFAERQSLETPEPAKRTRVRVKSNGSSQRKTTSSASRSTKRTPEKIATEKAPLKKAPRSSAK